MAQPYIHAHNGNKRRMVNKASWKQTEKAHGFKKTAIGSNIFRLLFVLLASI